MKFKKILLVLFFYTLTFSNSYSIEPDVFVQSTVNRASSILSKDISKEKKIDELKIIAKETVDITGVGFYSLGSVRKNLTENQKINYSELLIKFQELYENLKNNDDLVSCMKKAATTLLSEDPVLGLMILFSYDFLFVSHPCICAYLENLEDTFKEKLFALQERIKTFVSKE